LLAPNDNVKCTASKLGPVDTRGTIIITEKKRPKCPIVQKKFISHGYEPTREAAMAAFAKRWRRE
jgi:hypothetical protein